MPNHGSRSAKGWHEDIHDIPGKGTNVPHINIYNKKRGFNAHIFLGGVVCILMNL